MKRFWICCLLVAVVYLPIFGQSKGEQYQTGKIIAVDKLPDQKSQGSTDAPLQSDVHDYDLSIQVGDTVYVCRYHLAAGKDASWLEDKEEQVRIKGKVMYIKRADGELKTAIRRTTKAGQ
jgi:hypothetical protein